MARDPLAVDSGANLYAYAKQDPGRRIMNVSASGAVAAHPAGKTGGWVPYRTGRQGHFASRLVYRRQRCLTPRRGVGPRRVSDPVRSIGDE